MLYHLLYPLATKFIGFNVFRYVTFRSVYAAVTAFAICLFFGGAIIGWMRSMQLGEKIRTDGPASHTAKAGTHPAKEDKPADPAPPTDAAP